MHHLFLHSWTCCWTACLWLSLHPGHTFGESGVADEKPGNAVQAVLLWHVKCLELNVSVER